MTPRFKALARYFSMAIALLVGAPALNAHPVSDALQNITTLNRPGQVGYATFWEGNKFVQCRRTADRSLRCEAAGALMQPSLRNVLTADRLNRLAAMRWTPDPNFGGYVRIFPADLTTEQVAGQIISVLTDVYGATTAHISVRTAWVADLPCPPRAGFSQNLAGSVNNARSMARYAITTCAYRHDDSALAQRAVNHVDELAASYGGRIAGEFQRLRINRDLDRIYVVINSGLGYIQCAPDSAHFYCEAQSAESWPALAAILTPDRVSRLKMAGYDEPGHAPNYSRKYAMDAYSDAALAREVLTILFDVYGYRGVSKLDISAE